MRLGRLRLLIFAFGVCLIAGWIFTWHLGRVKKEVHVKLEIEGGFIPYYFAKFGRLPTDLTGLRDFLPKDRAYQTLSFIERADPQLSGVSTDGARYEGTLKFRWFLGGVYHISLDKAIIRGNAEHYTRGMAHTGSRR